MNTRSTGCFAAFTSLMTILAIPAASWAVAVLIGLQGMGV